MAQTEGEKELVLGNKQLISLFFVVVALCGVFFAMGYMMGRPAAKTALVNADAAPAAQPSDTPEDTAQVDQQSPAPAAAAAVDTDTTGVQPQAPATETRPAHDTPAPDTPAKPTPVAEAPPPPIRAAKIAIPQAGATYLQVTALRRADADNLVKTLREQSLPALLADSSKPDLFRVLVGPYHQTADVAEAKSRLKALGFANAFVQKE